MKRLKCEMCGSSDLIKQDGIYVCQSCGCKYTVEEAKKLLVEVSGNVDVSGSTVKIDNSDAIKQQMYNWRKIADSAYNNRNFPEAYTYYSKIAENDTSFWLPVFRKGMCIAWQGTLKDLHVSETLGACKDAQELLWNDKKLTVAKKADGIVIMFEELYDWTQAISKLAQEHYGTYAYQSVSAACDYFRCECFISELILCCIALINEDVYQNCSNKKNLQNVNANLCALAVDTEDYMDKSFNINTGQSYEKVIPDYRTKQEQNKLKYEFSNFEKKFNDWGENYEQYEIEKARKERENRVSKFWKENPDVYSEYLTKSSDLKNAKTNMQRAEKLYSDAKKRLDTTSYSYDSVQNTINLCKTNNEQLSKKIMGKKKTSEEIMANQKQIYEYEVKLKNLELDKNEEEKLVNRYKENFYQKKYQVDSIQREINEIYKVAERGPRE